MIEEAFGAGVSGAWRQTCGHCSPFPAYFGLALVAPDVVPLAFGPQWALSGRLLVILCLSAAPITLQSLIWPALAALGRSDRAALGILFIIASAALFTSCAAPFGLYAVVAAHVARTYATLPITLALLRRHAGVGQGGLLAGIARPFAAATVMAGVLAPVMLLPGILPVVRVVGLIGAGALIYAALMARSALPLVRDLRGALAARQPPLM